MDKNSLAELKAILILLSQIGILVRLQVYTLPHAITVASSKILENTSLPEPIIDIIMDGIPSMLVKMSNVLTEESLKELRVDIKNSGLLVEEFIQHVELYTPEETAQLETLSNLITYLSLPEELKVSESNVDLSPKELHQQVMIGHPLFTNMIVSNDGIQMPSDSLIIPAAPELAYVKAHVVAVNCNATYVCGACNGTHIADVKIAFEDTSIEFYINNDFLKPYVNEDKSKSGD